MDAKELLTIVRRNIFTPVVIALYALSFLLLAVKEYKDAWFVSFVITLNTVFAIAQEVRARRALKKLELLNAPSARLVMPDGTIQHIPFDEVVVGQHLEVIPGDDIPADGLITESRGLEVNESMLTGESAPVVKQPKDTVYASSTVTAGTAAFTVTATGGDTRAGIITQQLKQYAPELTPLQKTLARLITGLTIFAIFISALIFFAYSKLDFGINVIIKTITSAGTVIIPEGLILGSTVLLAYGSLRLARAKVLPQKLSAIEAMALVQVLCTDKTGTLTSESISFESIIPLTKSMSTEEITALCGAAVGGMGSGSSTADALVAALPTHPEAKTIDTLAFTSARKLSGARFILRGTEHTLFIGAPEFVTHYAPLTASVQKQVTSLSAQGMRVLLVAEFTDNKTPLTKLTQASATPLALITLRNDLREGVKDTVKYLQQRNVSIRVISGDNPDTVAYIAAAAGIKDTDKTITGAQLEKLSPKQWDKTVLATTIFARVLPEQKERLISTFQKHGMYTGMVGDGVNDALALKKSDLGVAMFSGANASRRVADIILLNNSFNSLPIGMRLGNRIMLAIEIIAILFFHKIMYGIITLLSTIALAEPYPFAPRHNTFMNVFMVTLPTIMLTLFPPRPRVRINPKDFWRNTLLPTIPMALVSGITVTLAYLYAVDYMHLKHSTAGTVSVMVATIMGISMVFRAPQMLAVVATKSLQFARGIYIALALVIASASFGITFARDFFDFTRPTWEQFVNTWPVWLLVVVAIIIHYAIAGIARSVIIKNKSS